MTTETNTVFTSFKDAFAPVTDAFKNFQNLEVPEAARDFVKKQAETAKVRAADFYAGSEKATVSIDAAHQRISGDVTSGAAVGAVGGAIDRGFRFGRHSPYAARHRAPPLRAARRKNRPEKSEAVQ